MKRKRVALPSSRQTLARRIRSVPTMHQKSSLASGANLDWHYPQSSADLLGMIDWVHDLFDKHAAAGELDNALADACLALEDGPPPVGEWGSDWFRGRRLALLGGVLAGAILRRDLRCFIVLADCCIPMPSHATTSCMQTFWRIVLSNDPARKSAHAHRISCSPICAKEVSSLAPPTTTQYRELCSRPAPSSA
jgi:hypothetical protein